MGGSIRGRREKREEVESRKEERGKRKEPGERLLFCLLPSFLFFSFLFSRLSL
jgi:hypothetical protein